MAIVLIVVSFISTWLILFLNEPRKDEKFRVSFLKALIIQACLIAVSTEALSFVRALEFNHIALFWTLVSIVNFYVLWSCHRGLLQRDFIDSLFQFKQLSPPGKRYLSVITAIAIISLITCLIAPPNNYDSLTYHMTRVMQWIQNRSLEYYPTHNLRQIFLPPGASYIVAQLQILSSGDYFANCVQWLAYIGSILGVSLITKQLVSDRAQWPGAALCATIPMAVMQSTTTQTDLVTSLWLVCLTYFVFQFQLSDRSSLFWITASFGLAITTKPTGIIFGVPLLVIFAYLIVRESLHRGQIVSMALSMAFKLSTIVGLGSLLLPMPSWARNLKATGKLFGEDFATRSEVHNGFELLSNVLKNCTLNLPIPGFTQLIVFLHQHLLPVDINSLRLNFSSITFDTVMVSPITLLIPSEDNIANPLHFILGAIALVSLFVVLRKNKNLLPLALLGLAVTVSYLLFCYLLKWQPWGNRLILPLFVLQSPIVAHYVTTNFRSLKFDRIILAILSIIAIFYALTPIRHPLVALPTERWSPDYLGYHQSKSILSLPRQEIYYSATAKQLAPLHKNAVNTIVDQYQCQTIGFFSGADDVEYPLWILLNEKTAGNFRMKHVEVKNGSQKFAFEFPNSEVCALLTSQGKTLQVNRVVGE